MTTLSRPILYGRSALLALELFIVNFLWEMEQARFYSSMKRLPFWSATWLCIRAAAADVALLALFFTIAALVARDGAWPLHPGAKAITTFFGLCLLFDSRDRALGPGHEALELQQRHAHDPRSGHTSAAAVGSHPTSIPAPLPTGIPLENHSLNLSWGRSLRGSVLPPSPGPPHPDGAGTCCDLREGSAVLRRSPRRWPRAVRDR